jgi:hypothetical protein
MAWDGGSHLRCQIEQIPDRGDQLQRRQPRLAIALRGARVAETALAQPEARPGGRDDRPGKPAKIRNTRRRRENRVSMTSL